MKTITEGNPASPLWIVGEAPGGDEIVSGRPFSGASGQLLDKMLAEAGFSRSQFFITNVCHERPPGNDISEWFFNKTSSKANGTLCFLGKYPNSTVSDGVRVLHILLDQHRPRFILALGNTALWALTGEWGILKWRASILNASATPSPGTKLVPTVHPADVLRTWSFRNIVVQDLRRARRESLSPTIEVPLWRFAIRPTFDAVMWRLAAIRDNLHQGKPYALACDIETRNRQITCFGIAWSKLDAICIPLICTERRAGYWTEPEEKEIVLALREILTHPNAHLIWQNGAYDLQYFAAQYGFLPNASDDTMLMQHTAFPGMRKGLDFLSSLYCNYHRYWKDDGKEWADTFDDDKHWIYNCEDTVRTYEVWETLRGILRSFGLEAQYRFQVDEVFPIVLRMMLRGIRADDRRKLAIRQDLETFILAKNGWLRQVLGHDLNVGSPKKMMELFYDDFSIPPTIKRATGRPTLDDEALDKIERRNPILKPLIQSVRDIRSARVAISNVLDAPFSSDGRARCTYNLTGAETFRLSSSEDAFGDGLNLQNITKGDEE